jgi:hypothetical protein
MLSRLAIAPNTPIAAFVKASVAAIAEVRACLQPQSSAAANSGAGASQLSCFWLWSDVRYVNRHKSARSDQGVCRILPIGFVTLLIAGHCYFSK